MKGTMYALVVIMVAVLTPRTAADTLGLTCEDHPIYEPGMKGILIRSWAFRKDGEKMFWPSSAYFTRHTQQEFAPLSADEPASKYNNLDYFVTHTDGKGNHKDFVTLNFQRPAKVFLLVHVWGTDETLSMTGWKSEGWVERVGGENRTIIGIGTRKSDMYATTRAYAFSKVGTSVTIGTTSYVKSQVTGMPLKGYWSALIGEENGKAVQLPDVGMKITPNQYCPDELHKKWVAKGTDEADPDTKNRWFATWHPQLDPCGGCYYDHEHGSNAKKLMGYAPKYGYTALKNNNQDESHKGFKDIVLDGENYYIYYGIHAHMGRASRFFTRFHTKVIAAVNKENMELELELAFKADYGFREVRLVEEKSRPVKRRPVNQEDVELAAELGYEDHCEPFKKRVINVINKDNLDLSLEFRDGDDLLHGQYEQWVFAGQPLCGKTMKYREPTVDFRNMALALKTADGNDTTVLGRKRDGKFVPQTSENRQFRSKNFVIAEELCKFALPDMHGTPTEEGKFYTNPYGTKIYSSSAEDRIAQFVKPGFKYTIVGDYEAEDTWDGLYILNGHGSIKDLNCLDYQEN